MPSIYGQWDSGIWDPVLSQKDTPQKTLVPASVKQMKATTFSTANITGHLFPPFSYR